MRKLDRIRRKRWYRYDEKLVHELFVKKSTLKANDIPGTLPHVMLLQHNNRDFHRTILWHLRNMDVCACKGLNTMITRCSEPQVRLDHLYLSKNGSASAWLPVISFVCDRVAWRWFSFAIRRIYYIEYMFFLTERVCDWTVNSHIKATLMSSNLIVLTSGWNSRSPQRSLGWSRSLRWKKKI